MEKISIKNEEYTVKLVDVNFTSVTRFSKPLLYLNNRSKTVFIEKSLYNNLFLHKYLKNFFELSQKCMRVNILLLVVLVIPVITILLPTAPLLSSNKIINFIGVLIIYILAGISANKKNKKYAKDFVNILDKADKQELQNNNQKLMIKYYEFKKNDYLKIFILNVLRFTK